MSRAARPPVPPSAGRRGRLGRVFAASAVAAGIGVPLAATPAGAAPSTGPYAALGTPGPALSPSPATLAAALKCTGNAGNTTGPTPVLLVPATGVTPEQNYDWNAKPTLVKLGIPFCTIELPDHSLGDIQTAGEYVTHGIRELHRRAGRKISIIGHSQGGMLFRWSLRFWPDTRAMVDDAIGFAGSNHGTTALDLLATCGVIGCPPATLQQGAGARFIAALNSGQETFPGISYSNIRTNYDEVVTPSAVADPAAASSSLTTGNGRITNVAIQDVCPGDPSEHVMVGTTSNTSYALALDALTHDGPANPSRIASSVCASPFMPGVDPANVQANLTGLSGAPGLISVLGVNLVGAPVATEEPPLKPYVFARSRTAGTGSAAAIRRARLRVTPGRIRAGRATRLTIRTTATTGGILSRERVRVLGRNVRTDRRGRATLRVRPRKAGLVTARATGNGLPAATVRIRVLRAR